LTSATNNFRKINEFSNEANTDIPVDNLQRLLLFFRSFGFEKTKFKINVTVYEQPIQVSAKQILRTMKYFTVILCLVAQGIYAADQSGKFALVYFGETSRSEVPHAYKKIAYGKFSMDMDMKTFSVSVDSIESYGDPEANTYLLPEVIGEFNVFRVGDRYEASSKALDHRELEVATGYFEMLINALFAMKLNEPTSSRVSSSWDRQGNQLRLKESPRLSFNGKYVAETYVYQGTGLIYFLKVDADIRLSQFQRLVGFLRSDRANDYERFLKTFQSEFSLLLNETGKLPSCSVIAINLDED
jgi:hypothetical protein